MGLVGCGSSKAKFDFDALVQEYVDFRYEFEETVKSKPQNYGLSSGIIPYDISITKELREKYTAVVEAMGKDEESIKKFETIDEELKLVKYTSRLDEDLLLPFGKIHNSKNYYMYEELFNYTSELSSYALKYHQDKFAKRNSLVIGAIEKKYNAIMENTSDLKNLDTLIHDIEYYEKAVKKLQLTSYSSELKKLEGFKANLKAL